MRIVVVRHYKTKGNVANEIIGWGESPPADGWQADMFYVLQQLEHADIYFAKVCTSALERARKTGEVYAQELQIEKQQHSPALNELDYGSLSKKSKHWVEKHHPQHKKDPAFIYPQGESFKQMQRRSVQLIEKLVDNATDSSILIVAHAGVIRGLVCHFLGLDYGSNLKQKISHRYIGDFQFKQGRCRQYKEWGEPSGFLSHKIIATPWRQ